MRLGVCSRTGDIIEPMLKPQWWVNCADMAKRKHLSIHLSIYLSIYPFLSIFLSINQSIVLSIQTARTWPSVRIYPSIHLAFVCIFLSLTQSINVSIHLFIYSIYLSISMLKPQWWVNCADMAKRKHLSIYPSIYLSFLSIVLSLTQSINVSIHLFIYSIYLSISMLKPRWWVNCAGMAKREHLSIHLSIYLSSVPLHLSISQSIYLSIYRSSYSVYLDCAGMAKRKHP